MPDKYSNSYPNPDLSLSERNTPLRKLRHLRAVVEFKAADDPGQKYYIAKLPGTAVLSAASTRRHAAVTGLNDVDLGDSKTPDALLDGASFASAAAAPVALFGANPDDVAYQEPLWKLLGYTSDPGEVDLFFTAKADVAADVDVEIDLIFSLPE